MNDNIKMFEDMERLLSEGRLTAAFGVLDNAIMTYPGLRQFAGELERLRQGYGYMSGYALDRKSVV